MKYKSIVFWTSYHLKQLSTTAVPWLMANICRRHMTIKHPLSNTQHAFRSGPSSAHYSNARHMKLLNWSIFPYRRSFKRMNLPALCIPHNPGLAWSSPHAIHAYNPFANANISQGTKAGGACVRVVSESSRSVHIVNDQANWIPLISRAHAWWISALLLHIWQGRRKTELVFSNHETSWSAKTSLPTPQPPLPLFGPHGLLRCCLQWPI